MKSTQAMRDRIRELMSREQDDYDRAVECVLDDLEGMLTDAQGEVDPLYDSRNPNHGRIGGLRVKAAQCAPQPSGEPEAWHNVGLKELADKVAAQPLDQNHDSWPTIVPLRLSETEREQIVIALRTTPPSVNAGAVRERFEEWSDSRLVDGTGSANHHRYGDGYCQSDTNQNWKGWQAGWNAALSLPAAGGEASKRERER